MFLIDKAKNRILMIDIKGGRKNGDYETGSKY